MFSNCMSVSGSLRKALNARLAASSTPSSSSKWRDHMNRKKNSKYTACHPANRDGVGCVGSDCHLLLDDILAVGWDPSAPKPVCVEVRDTHDEVVAFNEKMI